MKKWLILSGILLCGVAFGANYQYQGNASNPNAWFADANWSDGGGAVDWPTAADNALFASGLGMTISQTVPVHGQLQVGRGAVNTVTIAAGGVVSNSNQTVVSITDNGQGTLILDGGSLTTVRLRQAVSGAPGDSLVQVKDGALDVNMTDSGTQGTIDIGEVSSAVFELSGGTVSVESNLNLHDGELRVIGATGALSTLAGFYLGTGAASDTQLVFELNSSGEVSPIQANSFVLNGTGAITVDASLAPLGAVLNLVLIDLAGDTFSAAEFTSLSNALSTSGVPGGELSLSSDSSQLLFSGTVTQEGIVFLDTFDGNSEGFTDINSNLAARQAGGTTGSTYSGTVVGQGTYGLASNASLGGDNVNIMVMGPATSSGEYTSLDLDTDFGVSLAGNTWALSYTMRIQRAIGYSGYTGFTVGNPADTTSGEGNGFSFQISPNGDWTVYNAGSQVGNGSAGENTFYNNFTVTAAFDESAGTVALSVAFIDSANTVNLGTFAATFTDAARFFEIRSALGTTTATGRVDAVFDNLRIDVSTFPVLVTAYDVWSYENALVEGALGDDDSDGLSNLGEYSAGGDPRNPLDQGTPAVFGFVEGAGTHWMEFIYPQRIDPEGNLRYALELSTNLLTGFWTDSGYATTGTNVTGNALDFVTNQINATADQQFVRLKTSMLSDDDGFTVVAESDPALTTHSIFSGDFELGISDVGGGYINRLTLPGVGDVMGPITDRFGRGGQSAIRDALHGSRYNPTQAGFSDEAGTICRIHETLDDSALIVASRPCCLFRGDGQFDFTEWENLVPDNYTESGGSNDWDTIDESLLVGKQATEVTSEFDYYCTYEDWMDSGATNESTIPCFRHYYEYRYVRDPGHCILQHNLGPLYDPVAGEVTDLSVDWPSGVYAAESNELGVLQFSISIRMDRDRWAPEFYGYITGSDIGDLVMRDRGSNVLARTFYQNTGFASRAPEYVFPGYASVQVPLFILAESDDIDQDGALGLYFPDSDININSIVGVDDETEAIVYKDDRRLHMETRDSPFRISTMQWDGFRGYLLGMLNPTRTPAGTHEVLRGEFYLLYGSPREIFENAQSIQSF